MTRLLDIMLDRLHSRAGSDDGRSSGMPNLEVPPDFFALRLH